MKSVKVYELKETDLLVEDADNLYIHQCSNDIEFVQNSRELYSSSFTSVNIPIRKYISNGKEFYFAFDQKLDKVFKSSYGVDDLEGEIKLLRIRNKGLSETVKNTHQGMLRYKDKLFIANVKLTIIENMSLWQRIIFLFTGRTT